MRKPGCLHTASVVLFFAAVAWAACLLVPRAAFGQDVQVTPEELVAPSSSTPLGTLLQWGYLALVGIAGTVALKVHSLIATKDAQGRFWQVFNKLWVKAQTTVSYAEGQLRPTIQKAMADGKLDPAERKEIADKAWEIFREKAHDELKALPRVMQIVGDAAIEQFGRGLLERALGVLQGEVPPPTVPPTSAPTPKP